MQQNFIAQTGDPTGTGTGGDSIYGYIPTHPCEQCVRWWHAAMWADTLMVSLLLGLYMESRRTFLRMRFARICGTRKEAWWPWLVRRLPR